MSAALPTKTGAPTRPVLIPEVQATIDTAIERLVAEFHPEQIWLFGSYAWGEPTRDSDLDFAIIVPTSDVSPLKRAQRAHGCLAGLDMPNDVLVKTRAEFDRFRNVKPSLTFKIANEGSLLFESAACDASCSPSNELSCAALNLAALFTAWLTKAHRGLTTARRFSSEDDSLLGGAVFHCRHAAETSLKAFLAAREQGIEKTHDLKRLVAECSVFNPSFAGLETDAALLASLVCEPVYPDDIFIAEPTRAQFDEALAAAQRIYDFVLSVLPPETHPI